MCSNQGKRQFSFVPLYLYAFVLCLLPLVNACTSTPTTPTATPFPTDCSGIADTNVTCIDVPPASMLLQSPLNVQVTIHFSGISVTLGGTLLVTLERGHQLTVAVIEGVGVVGANGATRILQPGAQEIIPLGGDDGLQVNAALTSPYPFDVEAVQRAPLPSLPRPVKIPAPIAPPPDYTPPPTHTPTPLPTTPTTEQSGTTSQTSASAPAPTRETKASPGASATACAARPDWTATYTVQRGDTLSRIAGKFGVTTAELQAGNCITNADRILRGQVLHVPGTPGANPNNASVTATFTPTSANFRADRGVVQPGECTTMRWDVDNVTTVTFENEQTTNHNTHQVCPTKTTTYTLSVVSPDGSRQSYSLTIEVATSAAPRATSTPVG
jgi:LysM repeat protein